MTVYLKVHDEWNFSYCCLLFEDQNNLRNQLPITPLFIAKKFVISRTWLLVIGLLTTRIEISIFATYCLVSYYRNMNLTIHRYEVIANIKQIDTSNISRTWLWITSVGHPLLLTSYYISLGSFGKKFGINWFLLDKSGILCLI